MVLPYINMHPPRVYTCSPSWTPLPPPSPYHPSGSSQCTSPKLPVSCIKPGLAICFLYDIIHVLMPFSQIIPHLPLPQSPKDCTIHLCLFCCLAYRVVISNSSHILCSLCLTMFSITMGSSLDVRFLLWIKILITFHNKNWFKIFYWCVIYFQKNEHVSV